MSCQVPSYQELALHDHHPLEPERKQGKSMNILHLFNTRANDLIVFKINDKLQ